MLKKTCIDQYYSISSKTGNITQFYPQILAKKILAEKHVLNLNLDENQTYTYNNGVYSIDELLREEINQNLNFRDANPKKNRISTLYEIAEIAYKNKKNVGKFDHLINFKNGMFNTLDNTIIPHDPIFFSTNQIDSNYVEGNRSETWHNFLNDCLPESEHGLLQEIMGYLLSNSVKAQKAFFFLGEGGSGKGTIIKLIVEMLGKRNVSSVPFDKLSDRFKTASLFGKMANVCGDLSNRTIDEVGMFKRLTDGEDLITAEYKGKDVFHFQNKARLLYSCNALPRITEGADEALYRRMCILNFNEPLEEEKRNTGLIELLIEEREGIISWAIEGLKRVVERGYKIYDTEMSAISKEEYRKDNNNIHLFLSECCLIDLTDSSMRAHKTELFRTYESYCYDSGLKPFSNRKFYLYLSKLGVKEGKKDSKKGRFLDNITMVNTYFPKNRVTVIK
jgi:putative DNA primase/helicase